MENSPLEGKKNPASTILDIMEDSVARSYFFFYSFQATLNSIKEVDRAQSKF